MVNFLDNQDGGYRSNYLGRVVTKIGKEMKDGKIKIVNKGTKIPLEGKGKG